MTASPPPGSFPHGPDPTTTPGRVTLPGDPTADPTAVMGRRALAWVLDLLLFLGLAVGLYAAQAEYVDIPAGVGDTACQQLESTGGNQVASCAVFGDRAYVLSDTEVATQTLASFGWLVLFIVLQGVAGGSPGKLLAGVRVVDEQGQRPGIGKSLGRTVLWAVDGAPWIVPIVGPIVALTTTGHRRVGDMAAGTYVVARADAGRPVVVAGPAAPPVGQAQWGAAPSEWPGGPPVAPPTPSPESGPGSQRPAPPEPELDIRSLDVPSVTERVDQSAPTVDPDPAWWDDPSRPVEPPTTDEPPGLPDDIAQPPAWEPPEAPDVTDPMDEWEPPTAPEGPAPFVAPGAEPSAPGASPTDPSPSAAPTHHELPPPQWDEARNTYLQWDPNQQAWLQWDTQREQWKPLDT